MVCRSCPSVLPTLLHSLTHSLGVFASVVFVEIRCLNICRRSSVRVVEKTNNKSATAACSVSIHRCVVSPLDTGQDRRDIVRRTPPVLEDIQTQLAGRINVGMKHFTDELNSRWLIWVLLFEMHDESKGTVFEGGIGRSNDDGVPGGGKSVYNHAESCFLRCIPCHNIISYWRGRHARWRICLHALMECQFLEIMKVSREQSRWGNCHGP